MLLFCCVPLLLLSRPSFVLGQHIRLGTLGERTLFSRGLLGVLGTLHDLFCSLLLMVGLGARGTSLLLEPFCLPTKKKSFCSARTSKQGPLYPTLRANPFPEVTDLFCRLPLPTLFY